MIPELKPCPFCSGNPDYSAGVYEYGVLIAPAPTVTCEGCGAHVEGYEGEQDAFDKWNRRELAEEYE